MSRYVHVAIRMSRSELLDGLVAAGLAPQVAARMTDTVMLDGSLECAGEPVHVRLPDGTCGAVEDFGFRVEADEVTLVCGDVDRRRLERELLAPLRAHVASTRVRASAEEEGLMVEEVRETNGQNHTFHAGAWLGDGLQEGAVRSACEVSKRLGGRVL